jgi:rare lipoprotein A
MKSLPITAILLCSVFILQACGVTGRSASDDFTPPPRSSKKEIRDVNAIETGVASWYGPDFHGRQTANGEKYDMNGMTAAHRTLPFNTMVLVENLDNGKTVEVRINDRGPFAKNRIIDLSKAAATQVDMIGPGTARVRIYLMNGEALDLANIKTAQYTVQLGSYTNFESAEKAAAKIRSARVEEVIIQKKKVYRIYFGDFTNPAIALEAQKRLEGLGHKGFVKQIGNDF